MSEKSPGIAKTNPNTLTMTFDAQRTAPLITGEPWQQLGATFILVHELTHVFTTSPNAGVYGHREMARTASAAAVALGLNVKDNLNLDFPDPQDFQTDDQFDTALSDYFNRTLSYACRKVKL